jgi:hypothetical protein
MIQQEFWDWLTQAFSNLPRSRDPFFRRLWGEGLLRFNQPGQIPDGLDEWSARLVCAGLERRQQLFILLPDFQPRRPALLFATGLIMCALDHLRILEATLRVREGNTREQEDGNVAQPIPAYRVLYFGSTVGIRQQLGQIELQGRLRKQLNLADVFQEETTIRKKAAQTRVVGRRGRRATEDEPEIHLPRVLCVYAPPDPVAILEQHPANWIAVDCGDEAELHWLFPLLQGAVAQGIPLIAWGQNPLSECVTEFAQLGNIFQWAVPPAQPSVPAYQLNNAPELAFHAGVTTRLQPVVLEGDAVDDFAPSLRDAGRVLARGTRRSVGPLGKDTLRAYWGYLRSLEVLSVPYNFYEVEAPRLWGLKSFTQWQAVCERFRAATSPSYPDLCTFLDEAHAHLELALEYLRTAEPPLWSALVALCAESAPVGAGRLFVFASAARRQLFALALLARHNLSEEDLLAHRVWLLSLEELRRAVRWRALARDNAEDFAPFKIEPTLRWHPILVGLPSPIIRPKLLPVLSQETVDVLLYPYQAAALVRRAHDWAEYLTSNPSKMAIALSRLLETVMPDNSPEIPPRLYVDASAGTVVQKDLVKTRQDVGPLLQLEDPVGEIAYLLEADEETVKDDIAALATSGNSLELTNTEEMLPWCESAIEIKFDQGWQAHFAPDEMINVIVTTPSGQQIDARYVRSLNMGDRVVVIYGQQRQNLYDLIISRVHQHPSIELHLALIRRWQDDFSTAFNRWRQHGVRNLEELLRQMQSRGSTLISSLTLRQWLSGETLCPQDEGDLCRLAEVLDLGFVRQYHRRIYRAANRLRGLHRGLALRLNHWLEQQTAGLATGNDDDLIDSELGLTFGDFRSSLLILRVSAVQSVAGPFMRTSLGKLEKDTNC